MGVCPDTGLITGCAVMEERTPAKMQEFVDELPPALLYCSDGFSIYKELVWPLRSEHLISIAKERTNTIESINAQLHIPGPAQTAQLVSCTLWVPLYQGFVAGSALIRLTLSRSIPAGGHSPST